MKKALGEMQTLRAGRSKAEPKIFATQTRFPGARDGQNLISWRRSLFSSTDLVWWKSMHAILSYRPTNKTTHTQDPQTNNARPKLSVQCNKRVFERSRSGKRYGMLPGHTKTVSYTTITLLWQ